MNRWEKMALELDTDQTRDTLAELYGNGEESFRFQKERYMRLIQKHRTLFARSKVLRLRVRRR